MADNYSRMISEITEQVIRYARPARNQMGLFGPRQIQGSLNFDEKKHPRESSAHDGKRPGEFAPKGEKESTGNSDSQPHLTFPTAAESVMAGKSHAEYTGPISDAFVNEQINEDHPSWQAISNNPGMMQKYFEAQAWPNRYAHSHWNPDLHGVVTGFSDDLTFAHLTSPDGEVHKIGVDDLVDTESELAHRQKKGRSVDHHRFHSLQRHMAKKEAESSPEEPFTLQQMPASGHKKLRVDGNDKTRQKKLFDAGGDDLPGQSLLFNSDAGDLNNPRTAENQAASEKKTTSGSAPGPWPAASSDAPSAAPADVNSLVNDNIGLVKSIARRFASGADLDDAIQDGMVGLVKAAKAFDPSRGAKFSTFAYQYVQNETSTEAKKRRRRGRVGELPTDPETSQQFEPEDSASGSPDDRGDVETAQQHLQNLPDLNRQILEGHLSGESFIDLGQKHGIERRKVSQIVQDSIDQMRRAMGVDRFSRYYARQPISGQMSLFGEFDEKKHPREKMSHDGKRPGEFAPKKHGNEESAKGNHARKVEQAIDRAFNNGKRITLSTATKATEYGPEHRDMIRRSGDEIQVAHGKNWLTVTGRELDSIANQVGVHSLLDEPETASDKNRIAELSARSEQEDRDEDESESRFSSLAKLHFSGDSAAADDARSRFIADHRKMEIEQGRDPGDFDDLEKKWEESLSKSDRPRMSYHDTVKANMQHMGTTMDEWTSLPIKGFAETSDDNGNRVSVPEFEFPKDYKPAPSLFSGQDHCCHLCGHDIKNVFWVQNDKKKWTMPVGSECVTGFMEGKSGKQLAKEEKWKINRDLLKQAWDAHDSLLEKFGRKRPRRGEKSEHVFLWEYSGLPDSTAKDLFSQSHGEENLAAFDAVKWLRSVLFNKSGVPSLIDSKRKVAFPYRGSNGYWTNYADSRSYDLETSDAVITRWVSKHGDRLREVLDTADEMLSGKDKYSRRGIPVDRYRARYQYNSPLRGTGIPGAAVVGAAGVATSLTNAAFRGSPFLRQLTHTAIQMATLAALDHLHRNKPGSQQGQPPSQSRQQQPPSQSQQQQQLQQPQQQQPQRPRPSNWNEFIQKWGTGNPHKSRQQEWNDDFNHVQKLMNSGNQQQQTSPAQPPQHQPRQQSQQPTRTSPTNQAANPQSPAPSPARTSPGPFARPQSPPPQPQSQQPQSQPQTQAQQPQPQQPSATPATPPPSPTGQKQQAPGPWSPHAATGAAQTRPSGSTPSRSNGKADWITIGGHADAEGHRHAGGTPVKVEDDGTIAAGPPSLKGKDLDDLDKNREQNPQQNPQQDPPGAVSRMEEQYKGLSGSLADSPMKQHLGGVLKSRRMREWAEKKQQQQTIDSAISTLKRNHVQTADQARSAAGNLWFNMSAARKSFENADQFAEAVASSWGDTQGQTAEQPRILDESDIAESLLPDESPPTLEEDSLAIEKENLANIQEHLGDTSFNPEEFETADDVRSAISQQKQKLYESQNQPSLHQALPEQQEQPDDQGFSSAFDEAPESFFDRYQPQEQQPQNQPQDELQSAKPQPAKPLSQGRFRLTSEGRSHAQSAAESFGIDFDELIQTMKDQLQPTREWERQRNEAISNLKQRSGLNARRAGQIEDQYRDHSTVSNWDEIARNWAREYGEIFGFHDVQHDPDIPQKAWDFVREPVTPETRLADEKYINSVAEQVANAMKRRSDISPEEHYREPVGRVGDPDYVPFSRLSGQVAIAVERCVRKMIA